MRVDRITDLIGNTPLVKLNRINNTNTIIYAKLESFNPLHSVKDRSAIAMIETAEKEGKLRKGSIIIEPSSGNIGIALAYVAAVKGYKIILTMPETMSVEQCKLLSALGAEVVMTEESRGMDGAIKAAEDLAASLSNSFMPRQYKNPANPDVHEKTTGPEIWKDTIGHIDFLVGGVGSGGTLCGAGKYLKKIKKSIKVIAAEPQSSAVLSGGKAGDHKIEGIGAGFVPEVYNSSIIDEVLQVSDEDAGNTTRLLAKHEGILAGISSGAAAFAALTVGKRPENTGRTIVVVLPDTGERYLSTWLWDDL